MRKKTLYSKRPKWVRKWVRYGRYYAAQRRALLAARMASGHDFLLDLVCDLFSQCVGLTFFWALFANIPALVGYARERVLLMFGLYQFSVGLYGLLFSGMQGMGAVVYSGEFDGALMKPLPSLLQMLSRGTGDMGGFVLGIAVIAYSATQGALRAGWVLLWYAPLYVVCALILQAALYALIACGCFFAHNANLGLLRLFGIASDFARYPLGIYARGVRVLLTFALPLGFLGFYPASVFSEGKADIGALLMPIVTAGLATLAGVCWRAGVRRYRGAGN